MSSTHNIDLCMNPDMLMHQMDLADEEEEDEMDWELTATAVATIVAEVLVASSAGLQHDTPWQVLCMSKSDRTFITTMGFDTQTFEEILAASFSGTWDMTPIPQGEYCHRR
ncbi:hypothetical protein B0H19DRAFT_1264511 [Mycena capillaripes]|nr:hypothetical protein B0H19DRAFT_1264511 [Mycena capillaripes]